jgi:ATP/maltotriose-dependent transcriptional regulator MalT
MKIGESIEGGSLPLLTYTDKLLAAYSQTGPVERPKHTSMLVPLSERELEVLRLIATGCTNQEISERLVIAASTVKSHIISLYGKLGTHRRTEAILIAQDQGLLSE